MRSGLRLAGWLPVERPLQAAAGGQEGEMPLKDILVHLDGTERAGIRLGLAAGLARRHEAHLTALHVIDVELPAVFAGEAGGTAAFVDLLEDMRRDAAAGG